MRTLPLRKSAVGSPGPGEFEILSGQNRKLVDMSAVGIGIFRARRCMAVARSRAKRPGLFAGNLRSGGGSETSAGNELGPRAAVRRLATPAAEPDTDVSVKNASGKEVRLYPRL